MREDRHLLGGSAYKIALNGVSMKKKLTNERRLKNNSYLCIQLLILEQKKQYNIKKVRTPKIAINRVGK